MRRIPGIIFLAVLSIMAVAGCTDTPAAATPTAIATVSLTPDPCRPPQLEAQVERVHRHMREFDDAALLASSTAGPQLGQIITNMQKIRREADAESVPSCLSTLKSIQLQHMNSVINTLSAFVTGSDQQTIDQGIRIARQQHDQYSLELARLLGVTVVPAKAPPSTPAETPTP